METSSLPDAEFKTLVAGLLKELGGRAAELRENFNEEGENVKTEPESIAKSQSEMENA